MTSIPNDRDYAAFASAESRSISLEKRLKFSAHNCVLLRNAKPFRSNASKNSMDKIHGTRNLCPLWLVIDVASCYFRS